MKTISKQAREDDDVKGIKRNITDNMKFIEKKLGIPPPDRKSPPPRTPST